LQEYLRDNVPPELASQLSAIAETSISVRRALPFSTGITRGINPFGEMQTEIDVFANEKFASTLLSTGHVAEVASEEMADAKLGGGTIHVAMDPLDGSSNISTNNSLGSIFGFYSSKLPCSGDKMVGAAFVTYGPMLTLTFSAGGGVQTFVAVENEGYDEFTLMESDLRIPDRQEVFGIGGHRREWTEPVEKFVASMEGRGMKLRYGGTFVGDYNQVLRYGGIFGYPALKKKPKGKLRLLYEAAPMAYITHKAHGRSSDGSRDILSIAPVSLAETTPVFMGTESLVTEADAWISGR